MSAPTTSSSASSAEHPLVAVLQAFLGRAEDAAYLELLNGRLARLRAGEWPSSTAMERRRARAFLRSRMTWHDGDENLVRGWLDRGPRGPALLQAADELARIHPRRETLWYYLWAMESELDAPE